MTDAGTPLATRRSRTNSTMRGSGRLFITAAWSFSSVLSVEADLTENSRLTLGAVLLAMPESIPPPGFTGKARRPRMQPSGELDDPRGPSAHYNCGDGQEVSDQLAPDHQSVAEAPVRTTAGNSFAGNPFRESIKLHRRGFGNRPVDTLGLEGASRGREKHAG